MPWHHPHASLRNSSPVCCSTTCSLLHAVCVASDDFRGPRSGSRGLACTSPLLRSEWTCRGGGRGGGGRSRGLVVVVGVCRVEPLSAVVVSLRRAEADERETWATQIGLFVSCHGVRSAQWQARETLGTAEPSHPFMSLVGGRVCNHLYLDPSLPLTPILSMPTVIGHRVYMPLRGSTAVYHCSEEGEAKANLPSPTEANKPPPPSKPTSRRSSPSSTRCSRRLTLPDKM